MYYSLGYLPSKRRWYVLYKGSGLTPSINDIIEGTSIEGYDNHEDAYVAAERTGNTFISEYNIISFRDSPKEIKLPELIPIHTNLTFLIKILEHGTSPEDAAKIIGEGILEIEKKNFRVTDISPYFDCFKPYDVIIKLDISTLRPFIPEELVSMLTFKLEEIKAIPKGPISSLYCSPLIRILR